MSKRFFTTESLSILVNEIKKYVANAILTKADLSHSHTITDVDNLQNTLNTKAEQENLDFHINNTLNHITSDERNDWNAAKSHADSVHVTSVNGMSGDVVIDIPEAISIDNTLTQSGQAADAKVVGDAISGVETYILNIDYDATLAFDTSEVIFGTTNTTSVLGQAILGQMVLA